MTSSYLVVVERNGRTWRAQVNDVGRVHAPQLNEVERRARKLVWASRGTRPDDIDLHVVVQLPPAVHLRLNLAEQLCEEATREVENAIYDLADLGVSVDDVGTILRQRRWERRAGENLLDVRRRRSA